MNLKQLLFVITLFFGVLLKINAQQTAVRGQVIDTELNEPLIGVSVVVKGTPNGTITDINGNYSITASKPDVLEFSYVGMKKQTITVGNQSVIDVKMQANFEMDEVVVVGYGIVKKRDFTGSVASMKSDELMKARPVSIEQGLQGRLAGVHIVRNDGAPGGGITMQIRGTNSFLGGTEPLYVIDGVPLSTNSSNQTINFNDDKEVGSRNALSFLNPSDVESIEVLKDGSSIAIYGSRGANGVVMITTKSGSAGKDKINLGVNFTLAKVTQRLNVLGARDYANYQNQSFVNTSTINQGSYDPLRMPFPGKWLLPDGTEGAADDKDAVYHKGPSDFGNDPNYWQDVIFQTAVTKDVNLNYSGGSKGFDYSIGGSYIDQTGVVINSSFKRATLKINLNKELRSWLKIGTSTVISTSTSNMLKTATRNQNNGDEGVIRSALFFPPTYTVDSDITLGEYSTVANPKEYTEALNQNKNYNVYSSNYMNFTLAPGLIYRMSLGVNFSINMANRYFPRTLSEGRTVNGQSQAGDNTWESLVWDNLLMYNKTFDKKHNINGTLGTSWEENSSYYKMITTEGFGTDANNGWILQDGANPQIPKSFKSNSALLSYIFRAAYSYDSKYLLTTTMRRDASSKFAENHKADYFPSVGLGWTASREDFLKESNAITNLKLRYSFGSSGNASIGAYGSLAGMIGANYPFGNGVSNGYAPDPYNPGNPNLRWEKTYQHDAGIDISFFNRFDLTVDYYNKRTPSLIQNKEQAPSTGLSQVLFNVGEVTNKGIEIALNATIISNKDFTWRVGANFSKNKNNVVSTGEPGEKIFPNTLWNSLRPFVLAEGRPIGQMYGFVEDGIWNSREEVINNKQFQAVYPNYKVSDNDPATETIIKQKWLGEIRYKDLDDSGTITDSDQTFIGDANPKFTYGINMNFTYKNFDFSFLLDGVEGSDILNMSSLRFHDLGGTRNTLKSVYENAWTPEKYGINPKAYYDSSRKLLFSRRFVEDGSYLKLRNVSLAYSFVNPIRGITNARLFCTANNLLTFTKYTGYDPEVNAFGSGASMKGVDAGGYPQAKELMLGLNLTF